TIATRRGVAPGCKAMIKSGRAAGRTLRGGTRSSAPQEKREAENHTPSITSALAAPRPPLTQADHRVAQKNPALDDRFVVRHGLGVHGGFADGQRLGFKGTAEELPDHLLID